MQHVQASPHNGEVIKKKSTFTSEPELQVWNDIFVNRNKLFLYK